MITVFKNTVQGLETLPERVAGSWVYVLDPRLDEILRLQHELGIPESFINSSLDIDERARIDKEDSTTLLILRVPYLEGEAMDVPYRTATLGIILVKEYIVTICKYRIDVLDSLQHSRPGMLSTAKRNRMILYILLTTAQKYLEYLRRIDAKVEQVEDRLQRSLRNQEVLELLKYQKSLVYFTTGLKTNELLMQRLQRSQMFQAYPDDLDLLEDVLTENHQAIEMVNISSNILSQMMDAFASIISNNLNIVMKFLASVTIIISFPTLVASIYGMNVDLPLQNHPLAFLMVMSIALVISVGVTAWLWWRDWL